MMYQLDFLYAPVFIFIVGLIVSFFSHRWKLPGALLLLLTGIVLSKLPLPESISTFPTTFVLGVSVFGLIMVTYDVFSRIKPHRHDSYAQSSLRLTMILFGIALVTIGGISIAAKLTEDPFVAMLMCSLVAGISLPALMISSPRIRHFIETEGTFNEAFVIFICTLIIEFIMFLRTTIIDVPLPIYMGMFSLVILIGLGTGVFSGLVVFKIFRNLSRKISPIALIGLCLAVYIFAEALNGSGIFAIMSMAMLFGALTIKHKKELEEFSKTFSQSIEILVLLLLGMIVSIELTLQFFIISLSIFLAYLVVRYVSAALALRHDFFRIKDKLMITVMAPKGVAVSVITLSAIFLTTTSLMPLIQMVVAIILYSQILSWIVYKATG